MCDVRYDFLLNSLSDESVNIGVELGTHSRNSRKMKSTSEGLTRL